jgi:hypothetical protein
MRLRCAKIGVYDVFQGIGTFSSGSWSVTTSLEVVEEVQSRVVDPRISILRVVRERVSHEVR